MDVTLIVLLCIFVKLLVTDTVFVTPVGKVEILGVPLLITDWLTEIVLDPVLNGDIEGEPLTVSVLELVVLDDTVIVLTTVLVILFVEEIVVDPVVVLELVLVPVVVAV